MEKGYPPIMSTVRWLRWERLLLVAALVVGVLAMHATPDLCGSTPGPATVATGSADVAAGHAHAAVAGDDSDGECGTHHVLSVCLAILLAALLISIARRFRGPAPVPSDRPRKVISGPFHAERAPPRTAVRLAQLCVSRR